MKSDMRLAHKIAIVTGAGSGFGEGIARRFAAEGARIIINDIDVANGERVAREIVATGGSARFCKGDVSKDADVARFVAMTLEAFGDLDIVVNNAGTTHRNQPMLDVSEDEFDRIYRVNVKSLFLTAKHAVPHFRSKRAGAFITIASTAGVRGPHLVQRQQGRGDHDVTVDGGRAGTPQYPGQHHQSCGRRNRDARRLHGGGHTRDAGKVHIHDSAGPALAAVGCRDRGRVLRLR
jgi:NAD(P)-dependent dehydrogenase (short-subunit alcohol dehydrogenase family)